MATLSDRAPADCSDWWSVYYKLDEARCEGARRGHPCGCRLRGSIKGCICTLLGHFMDVAYAHAMDQAPPQVKHGEMPVTGDTLLAWLDGQTCSTYRSTLGHGCNHRKCHKWGPVADFVRQALHPVVPVPVLVAAELFGQPVRVRKAA